MFQQNFKVKLQFFPIIFFSILLGGCAVTKDYVNLQYVPNSNVQKIENSELITVTVKVNDIRVIKEKVSCKKNGYGMEMAPIISKNDVVELVSYAISNELSNRGFKIKKGGVVVSVELAKFYNDFKASSFTLSQI